MNVKISACTITKNEEKNIARSIESYKDYVDEIIIVDTGSTDNTVEIAKSLGAKVINFKWINDFAAAKNCAIDAATGDWILFLDADEWIKDNGATQIQNVVNRAISEGFDAISLRMLNLEDDGNVTEITSSLRFFVNKPNIRYIRKIHEYLFDSEKQRPLISLKSDEILLNHSGYATSISKTKINRNRELLEKNYLLGNAEAVDYFYLARENLTINPERARQFLNILTQDAKKMEEIKRLDIANNIHDLRLKLSRILINEYSIEERLKIVEDAIKDFPQDPTYYYYKYVILKEKNEKRLELLQKALELDKEYEKNVNGNNNAFSRYKGDVLCELGKEALIVNDTMKAMDYLVQSAQTGERNTEVLRDLLYIIKSQDLNEKISFLNSIYDVNKEEVLEFLVQSLRLTQYNDVFLYYFVKYYKNFGKVDISLFTSMLINKNYEDAAKKYLEILLGEADARAEILVVSAILAGNLKEFYDLNKANFSPVCRRILNGYFYDSKIEEITKVEEEIILKIVSEILYVCEAGVIEKLEKEFNNNEVILSIVVNSYLRNRSYKEAISEINKFIEEDLSDEFAGQITAILGKCFYKLDDYASAQLYFSQTVQIGYLDEEVAIIYGKILEKYNNKQELEKLTKYKKLLNKYIEANSFLDSNKIEEIDNKNCSESIEEFENEISNELNMVDSFKNRIFEYANKLFKMDKFYLAEEYYKISIRSNCNLGVCYYNLGKIYNKFGFANLSYHCYKKAFETSIDFPASVLGSNHKNRLYLYNHNDEIHVDKCPICNKSSELVACYEYIENENLGADSNLIVKYRKCEECNHIFAENCIEKSNFSKEIYNDDLYIFNAYDMKDKLAVDSKLLVISENKLLNEVLSKDFETEYIEASFEKTFDLKKLFKKINGHKNKTLVTIINDIDSCFEKESTTPLWARVDVINAYSKDSVEKLLLENGMKNIKIFDSKFLKGKIIVIAEI